jgi:hypothetical protein
VKRWLVLICALLIGAAAPARAWCEATCLAPADDTQSHCPTHDPAEGVAALSANSVDQCPVLESARPTVPARIDVDATVIASYVPAPAVRTCVTPSFARPHSATTVFERSTPLRI